jgi:hypothetical protein
MSMNLRNKLIASGAIAFALTGCGASGSSPQVPNQANISANVLQFAVGTANLYGTSTALNVVATYRQPKGGFHPGDSGSLLNSPTLTLPANILVATGTPAGYDACSTAPSGPSAGESDTNAVTSTSQVPGSKTVTSFGQSGGVFGYGIEPFNATGQGDCTPPGANATGTPFQVAPYTLPLYVGALAVQANAFTPWGGPPAFDVVGNGTSPVGIPQYPAGTAGVPLGIDVFAGVAPAAGTYTLQVSVPANTGTVTKSAQATIPAGPVVLGTATAPAPAFNGSGGATFAFTMPGGATEALVEVIDNGDGGANCNGASGGAPVYYTIKMTATGTATLGNNAGPGGKPSICTGAQNGGTGDNIIVYNVGFDYPFAESEYPTSLGNPSPAITGANATDDITVSAPASSTSP